MLHPTQEWEPPANPARFTRQSIDTLEKEINTSSPDPNICNEHTNRVLGFGLKMIIWAGERATKFADVSLKLLAPVVVAKITGLTPVLVDAGSAGMGVLGHGQ